MEEKKRVNIKVILSIVVLIVIVGAGVFWYIYANKNNNSQNDSSELSAPWRTDTEGPYKNYPDMTWTRIASINYPEADSDNASVWIDDSGIIHISDTLNNNSKEEITINALPENAKYLTNMISSDVFQTESLVVLTENGNLYAVDNFYNFGSDTSGGVALNDSPKVTKIASNIVEIYKDSTNNKIPVMIPSAFGVGTFIGIYALTTSGQLLSINSSDYYTGNPTYVLGLSYEDCNSVTAAITIDSGLLQVTKDGYLRDASDIQANYLLDNDKNKMSIKYSFYFYDDTGTETGGNAYIVTLDNKIYHVIKYTDINNYQIELLNNKTVSSVYYSNSAITVIYSDNTTDTFNVGQDFDGNNQKYGF